MFQTISGSVGKGGRNSMTDVKTVQGLINRQANKLAPFQPLAVDGLVGMKTIGAIEKFQRVVLRFNNVDGRVDVGGKTWQGLTGSGSGNGGGTGPIPTPGGAGQIKTDVGNLNLAVERFQATSLSIIGTLTVNGTFICYTLEEAWRNNQKSHSCVSLGTYGAFIRYDSTKANREWCFQLNDANGRTAIQMHIGNKPSHTEGCVLVGTSYTTDYVGDSTSAYQKLQDFVFGAGFTRADIRKAKPKFGTVQFTFTDKTPGISGR